MKRILICLGDLIYDEDIYQRLDETLAYILSIKGSLDITYNGLSMGSYCKKRIEEYHKQNRLRRIYANNFWSGPSADFDIIVNYVYKPHDPTHNMFLDRAEKKGSRVIRLTKAETEEKITDSIRLLSEAERNVLRDRLQYISRKKIGEKYGLSNSQVLRLEYKAMRNLAKMNTVIPKK